MAEGGDRRLDVERVTGRAIVALKIARPADAGTRLNLADPVRATDGDPRSLWLGPDHWLLVSETLSSQAIIEHCEEALTGILHNAVDQSDGLAVLRLMGAGSRDLLATGCGLDLRPAKFSAGACCSTRLAQIEAIVVAQGLEHLEIYVDRSYQTYLSEWISDSISITARAVTPPESSAGGRAAAMPATM